MALENPYIIPQAEPFYFPGNPTACLLIHGFTGTPIEMRPLGEYLSNQGYTVLGIRLAGHATQVDDMIRTRWYDWLASVEDGINLLRSNANNIITIGLSMGGILSLIAASRYPVIGTVAMAAPYTLRNDWRLKFLPLLRWLQPKVHKKQASTKDQVNDNDVLDHIDYPYYPSRSIMELIALQKEMYQCIPLIKVPVLLMHSKLDKTAAPSSMQTIYDQLNTKHKEMLWVEKSGHVITLGSEREFVFRSIHEFIQNIISQKTGGIV